MTDLDPYSLERAENYHTHHRDRWRTRLTTWRERAVLRAALRAAGNPATALDLPCGTGRFWPVFAAAGVNRLIAGDVSAGMLTVAARNRVSPDIPAELVATSAFDMSAIADGAVEFAACMRFLHHISMAEDRLRVLRELRRVSSRFVAISLWVDGNLGGNRRMASNQPEPHLGYGKRRCRPRQEVEAEFREAGFEIVRHYDVWPKLSMWRLYLLKRIDL